MVDHSKIAAKIAALRAKTTNVGCTEAEALADREAARAVQGVTIASEGEDFIVEPFEAEVSKESV